jgi:hypothetical protein
MLRVNFDKSGVVRGVGVDKLRIVIDGDSFEEVGSPACRELARNTSVSQGFGNGGQCDQPITGPVGADGNMLEGAAVLQSDVPVSCYRSEFLYTNRI